jgi:hypothetical protein
MSNLAEVWFSVYQNPATEYNRFIITLNGSSSFTLSNVQFFGVPQYDPNIMNNFGASVLLAPPTSIVFEGVPASFLGQFQIPFDDAVTGTVTIGKPMTVPFKVFPITGASGSLIIEAGQTSGTINFPASSPSAAPGLTDPQEAFKRFVAMQQQ